MRRAIRQAIRAKVKTMRMMPRRAMVLCADYQLGKNKEENGRLVMPVTVRLNHAIADGYLVANVFRLLEQEIGVFAGL
jgi:chloramphenicol O-acetyltransferase